MNLPYVIYLTTIASIIFLIASFLGTKNGALIIDFITFGPSGYRIPHGLLQELGLTKKKLSKIRVIKRDLIAIAVFSLAFGSLSLDSKVQSSEFLNALIHIASVITVASGFVKLIFGFDIGVRIIKDPDQEVIDNVIDYLIIHEIQIKTMSDFERNIDKFMHLLPTVDSDEKKLY